MANENIEVDCNLNEDGVLTCGIGKENLKKVVEKEISIQEVKFVPNQDVQIKSEKNPAEPKKSDVSSKSEASRVCSKTGHDKPQTMENEGKTTPEGVDSSQSEDKSSASDQKIVNNNQKLGEELTQKIRETIEAYLTKDSSNNKA